MTVSRLARSRAQMWSDLLVAVGGSESYKTMSEEQMLAAIRNTYGGSVSAFTTSESDLLASIVGAAGGSTSDLTQDEERMLATLAAALGGSGSALTSSSDALLAASVNAAAGDTVPYVAKAVHFNGSTYLANLDGLTVADSQTGSFSFWLKDAPLNAVVFFVENTSSTPLNCFGLDFESGQLVFTGEDDVTAQDGFARRWATDAMYVGDILPGWHHFVGGFDASVAPARSALYVDRVLVSEVLQFPNGVPFSMPLLGIKAGLGALETGGSPFTGDMADVWVSTENILSDTDDIVGAVLDKFITGSGKPVDPVNFPSGFALFSGDASTFANQGTGGAFVLTGTLTDASTSPSDSLNLLQLDGQTLQINGQDLTLGA
jgi:hypothetical protein